MQIYPVSPEEAAARKYLGDSASKALTNSGSVQKNPGLHGGGTFEDSEMQAALKASMADQENADSVMQRVLRESVADGVVVCRLVGLVNMYKYFFYRQTMWMNRVSYKRRSI